MGSGGHVEQAVRLAQRPAVQRHARPRRGRLDVQLGLRFGVRLDFGLADDHADQGDKGRSDDAPDFGKCLQGNRQSGRRQRAAEYYLPRPSPMRSLDRTSCKRRHGPRHATLPLKSPICPQSLDISLRLQIKCGCTRYCRNGLDAPSLKQEDRIDACGTPTRASCCGRLHDGADPMAWNDFFERYWPLVFSIARHRGCSRNTAEDVVQDVMLAVFRERPSSATIRRGAVPRLAGGRGAAESYRARRRANGAEAVAATKTSGPSPRRPATGPTRLGKRPSIRPCWALLLDVAPCREMSPVPTRRFRRLPWKSLRRRGGANYRVDAKRGLPVRKKVLRRLRELGAEYGDRGPPDEAIRRDSACVPSRRSNGPA